MQLFGSLQFFVVAIALSLFVLFWKRVISERYSPYVILTFCISLLIFFGVYRNTLLPPIALFFTSLLILKLTHRFGLKKSVGIVLTLIPLILVKTGMLSILSIIGISFITFRAIDTLLYADASLGVNAVEYFIYMFFPMALLAGPMYRWRSFKRDISEASDKLSLDRALDGWESVILGVIQKFGVAALINSEILSKVDPHDYSHHGILTNAFGYSAYLYFDFAGYSNMALGIAAMFGFDLPINFKNPIASLNPQDFWRRWHISLSEWLRDVVFMPIYKSLQKIGFFTRHKLLSQNIGIFATLFIMGTWDGLRRDYIVSGILFGIYSVAYNTMTKTVVPNSTFHFLLSHAVSKWIGRAITILLAVMSLYVFSGRSPV